MFGDPNQGEHVVLISDGSETCTNSGAAVDAARALASRGIRLSVIAVGFGFDSVLLESMASQGGGTFHVATTRTEFDGALASISGLTTGCNQPAHGTSMCIAAACAPTGGGRPCRKR